MLLSNLHPLYIYSFLDLRCLQPMEKITYTPNVAFTFSIGTHKRLLKPWCFSGTYSTAFDDLVKKGLIGNGYCTEVAVSAPKEMQLLQSTLFNNGTSLSNEEFAVMMKICSGMDFKEEKEGKKNFSISSFFKKKNKMDAEAKIKQALVNEAIANAEMFVRDHGRFVELERKVNARNQNNARVLDNALHYGWVEKESKQFPNPFKMRFKKVEEIMSQYRASANTAERQKLSEQWLEAVLQSVEKGGYVSFNDFLCWYEECVGILQDEFHPNGILKKMKRPEPQLLVVPPLKNEPDMEMKLSGNVKAGSLRFRWDGSVQGKVVGNNGKTNEVKGRYDIEEFRRSVRGRDGVKPEGCPAEVPFQELDHVWLEERSNNGKVVAYWSARITLYNPICLIGRRNVVVKGAEITLPKFNDTLIDINPKGDGNHSSSGSDNNAKHWLQVGDRVIAKYRTGVAGNDGYKGKDHDCWFAADVASVNKNGCVVTYTDNDKGKISDTADIYYAPNAPNDVQSGAHRHKDLNKMLASFGNNFNVTPASFTKVESQHNSAAAAKHWLQNGDRVIAKYRTGVAGNDGYKGKDHDCWFAADVASVNKNGCVVTYTDNDKGKISDTADIYYAPNAPNDVQSGAHRHKDLNKMLASFGNNFNVTPASFTKVESQHNNNNNNHNAKNNNYPGFKIAMTFPVPEEPEFVNKEPFVFKNWDRMKAKCSTQEGFGSAVGATKGLTSYEWDHLNTGENRGKCSSLNTFSSSNDIYNY